MEHTQEVISGRLIDLLGLKSYDKKATFVLKSHHKRTESIYLYS